VRVPFVDLERVIVPWTKLHGFRFSVTTVDGDERAQVEVDAAGQRFAIEAFALDAFGNVGVDLERDARVVRHAFTGPLPDLLRMLEEVRRAIHELPPAGDLN